MQARKIFSITPQSKIGLITRSKTISSWLWSAVFRRWEGGAPWFRLVTDPQSIISDISKNVVIFVVLLFPSLPIFEWLGANRRFCAGKSRDVRRDSRRTFILLLLPTQYQNKTHETKHQRSLQGHFRKINFFWGTTVKHKRIVLNLETSGYVGAGSPDLDLAIAVEMSQVRVGGYIWQVIATYHYYINCYIWKVIAQNCRISRLVVLWIYCLKLTNVINIKDGTPPVVQQEVIKQQKHSKKWNPGNLHNSLYQSIMKDLV